MIQSASEGERGSVTLVDFDWTLFDTTEFIVDLVEDISAVSGVDVGTVRTDLDHHHVDPVLGGYDLDAHARQYDLDPDMMWRRVDGLVRDKDYLYADSEEFIQELRGAGADPSILSFGEPRFQSTKIVPNLARLAGVAQAEQDKGRGLAFETVFEPKTLHIARRYPGRHGFLVDDKPGQNLSGGFVEVHFDVMSGLKSPKETETGFVVASLAQAAQVIKEHRRERS